MRVVIYVILFSLAIPAFGQRKPKTEDELIPVVNDGIVYALPRTGLRVSVKAIREAFEPGPYATYAEPLLGITGAETRPSVRWRIVDVSLKPTSEPDPGQVYKAMGPVAFMVNLTSDGRLAGVNSDREGKRGFPLATDTYLKREPVKNHHFFSRFNDSPMLVPGDSTNNFRPARISVERKAGEAAGRILECRQSRFHMAAGLMDEFHPDGEAYKVSLKELESMEKGYLSLFTGHTTHHSETFHFYYVPEKASDRGEVVFRFSEENGVLPASDLSGKPVTLKVEPGKELNARYAELAPSKDPASGSAGIYYRLPAMTRVSILYELNVIAESQMPMAQFGQTAPIPNELLTGEYAIEIHPETGAVASVVKK